MRQYNKDRLANFESGGRAWEEGLGLGKVEGDVASGVPRSVKDPHLELSKVPGVPSLRLMSMPGMRASSAAGPTMVTP